MMLNIGKIVLDGGILIVLGSVFLLAMMRFNPRLFLNAGDLPPDIVAGAAPKTAQEKRLAVGLGVPYLVLMAAVPLLSTLQFGRQAGGVSFGLLFGHAFAILMMFNLFDLLVLDWLLFCTITPHFMVVPGTEGFAGYKDYGFHLRQHAKSIMWMAVFALVMAVVVRLISR